MMIITIINTIIIIRISIAQNSIKYSKALHTKKKLNNA